MSKYEPLWKWIRDNGTDSFKLTVAVALGEAGQEEVVALHKGAVPTLQGVGGSAHTCA